MGNENLGEQMAVRNVADDENILWDFVKIFFLTFETNTSFLNLNTILCEFSKKRTHVLLFENTLTQQNHTKYNEKYREQWTDRTLNRYYIR